MPLKLNSTGGGSVTVDVPSTASNYTATLPASTGTVVLADGSNNVSVTNLTASGNVTAGGTVVMSSPFAMRNKIINGAMEIDQRNGGAAVSNIYGYFIDRWGSNYAGSARYSAQRSSVAPSGFINSMLLTVTTAASPGSTDYNNLYQGIEGFNIADLGWGTASAKTVTVSFWVRGSVTGTYGFRLCNSNATRSYVATYTISSANTWEQKTITIPGDTTGTWATDSTAGIFAVWDLGHGSGFNTTTPNTWVAGNYTRTSSCVTLSTNNGATFYMTGVQLEVGSVATPFERRLYNQEFLMCQRYYQLIYGMVGTSSTSTTQFFTSIQYPVILRATPTLSLTGNLNITDPNVAGYTQSSPGLTIVGGQNSRGVFVRLDNFSGINNYRFLMTNDFGNALAVSAEF